MFSEKESHVVSRVADPLPSNFVRIGFLLVKERSFLTSYLTTTPHLLNLLNENSKNKSIYSQTIYVAGTMLTLKCVYEL